MAKSGPWIVGLQPEQPVAAAAALTVRSRLAPLAGLIQKVSRRGKVAPETIHHLRVACRRAAAALELYADLLPAGACRWWQRRLRRWRRGAGTVRSLDVLLARMQSRNIEVAWVEQLEHQRRERLEQLREQLQSGPSAERLEVRREELIAALTAPEEAIPTVADWAAVRLAAAFEAFLASEPDDRGDLAALHAFRVAGKRLRYAFEVLAPTQGPPDESMYQSLEEFQTHLGGIQDSLDSLRYLGDTLRDTSDLGRLREVAQLAAEEADLLQETVRDFQSYWRKMRSSVRQYHKRAARRGEQI